MKTSLLVLIALLSHCLILTRADDVVVDSIFTPNPMTDDPNQSITTLVTTLATSLADNQTTAVSVSANSSAQTTQASNDTQTTTASDVSTASTAPAINQTSTASQANQTTSGISTASWTTSNATTAASSAIPTNPTTSWMIKTTTNDANGLHYKSLINYFSIFIISLYVYLF